MHKKYGMRSNVSSNIVSEVLDQNFVEDQSINGKLELHNTVEKNYKPSINTVIGNVSPNA